MSDIKYAGFISYAHADEAAASRLHRALETYHIPKLNGAAVGGRDRLSPIFRDTAELTAHHSLSQKIQEAVQASRFLIVICSPTAKVSHWVNEEIRLFRSLHGEQAILCVLAEGTPTTSFPTALLEEGREPLAANLSGGKDSFKLGTTQLAASMLGVGLDTLIQRETKRRRRRMQLITASALAFSGVMGVTALTAVEARNEAQDSRLAAVEARDEAQDSRAEAEGLVEYMITDLREKLDPVGRLDILDGVGERAVKYYDAQDVTKLSDESLLRQARARHVLGEVAIDADRKEDAIREIEIAERLTKDVFSRNPDDTDAIYAQAQSEYWVGQIHRKKGNSEGLLIRFRNYKLLTQKLYNKDPEDFSWIMEAGYGENNLGNFYMNAKEYERALAQFKLAINLYNEALVIEPGNQKALASLANTYVGASRTALHVNGKEAALDYRMQVLKICDDTLRQYPNNYDFIFRKTTAMAGLIYDELITEKSFEYNKLVQDINNGFERITNHDPLNVGWKREYDFFQKTILK